MNYLETEAFSQESASPEAYVSPHNAASFSSNKSMLLHEKDLLDVASTETVDPYRVAIRVVAGISFAALLFVASIYYGAIHP